jgi:hypothetical protein
VFTAFANSYIPGNIKAYYPDVSLTACAALCARDPSCLSFESGYAGREGDCFTSTVNRNSPGVSFHSNSFAHLFSFRFAQSLHSTSASINYYELQPGLTRCTAGFYSATNFGPNCTPCPAGTYAANVSRTQCISCPAGLTTPGTNFTSIKACMALSCPFISVGPDAAGSSVHGQHCHSRIAGDCTCPTGSSCTGPSCMISPTTMVAYFNVGCTTCNCTARLLCVSLCNSHSRGLQQRLPRRCIRLFNQHMQRNGTTEKSTTSRTP